MRKYYLYQNASGFYTARFIDPVTGRSIASKSTHTKDYLEAAGIVSLWLRDGIPTGRPNSRMYQTSTTAVTSDNTSAMMDLVNKLGVDEALLMIQMLHERVSALNMQNTCVALPTPPAVSADLREEFPAIIKRMVQTTEREYGIQVTPHTVTKTEPVITEPPAKAKVIVHKKAEQKAEPVKLLDYMRHFWDYKTSRWVVEQRALGYEPTERHCLEQYKLIDRYWAPYFGEDIMANEVDTEALQEFFFYLRIERELAGATVNLAISCGSRVFGYLYQKKLIAENPFERVKRFKKNEKERSIPTESEVAALLRTEWCNEPSYLAFYLGAFCGMRAGEISGLRMCDLDEAGSMIHVRHSWNSKDGLKSTKNTDTRSVPIDAGTLQRILCYARQNPKQGELSYVFWTPVDPTTPYWPSYYRDGLYEAMQSIGISEEQRKDRNIVFHSLRHFCATILTKRGDLDTVRQILGHRTEAMTKHYSNHESEEKQRAMREALDKSRDYIFSYAKEA